MLLKSNDHVSSSWEKHNECFELLASNSEVHFNSYWVPFSLIKQEWWHSGENWFTCICVSNLQFYKCKYSQEVMEIKRQRMITYNLRPNNVHVNNQKYAMHIEHNMYLL